MSEQDAAPEADTLSPFLQGIADLARDRLKQITARTQDVEQTVARLTAELDALRLEEIDAKRVLAAAERRQFGPSAPEVAEPVADVAARAGLPVADPDPLRQVIEDANDGDGEAQRILADAEQETERPTPAAEPTTPKSADPRPISAEAARKAFEGVGRFSVKEAADVFILSASDTRRGLAMLVDDGVLWAEGEGDGLRFSLVAAEPQAPEDSKPERQSGDKIDAKVAVENASGRKTWAFDRAKIRDWMRERGVFTTRDIQDTFGMSSGSVTNITREFMEKGTIKREKPGLYEFCKPNGGGPTHRPRKEPKIPATEAPSRGTPVAHTRERGRSGRPGYDRKRAGRGVKVKRHTSK